MPETDSWLFIQNPKAGDRRSRRRIRRLRKGLAALGVPHEWSISTHAGALEEIALEAVAKGIRNIAVVGGDGSLHEVVNGIMQAGNTELDKVTLALFPAGTGNDWTRTHAIPSGPSDWLKMLVQGRTIHHDIGQLSYFSEKKEMSGYFINVAGLAYDGFLVKKAGQNIWRERFPFYYLLLALSQLFRYRPQRVRVVADDKELADELFYTINLGICRFSGGGMSLTPHADPEDGRIALTLIRKVSKLGVLLNTWRFYTGRIGGHPKVNLYKVSEVRIESTNGRPLYLEADGEFLGEAPVKCRISSKKIKILVPEKGRN